MIQFTHPHLNNGNPLTLRLGPTKVEWTYNLNTSVQDTYGGQVIQLLSINYDKLSIEGRFGKEGPHGKLITKDDNGNEILESPKAHDYWQYGSNFNTQPYSVGLTQMTAFFQEYFAIASQGGDAQVPGRHFDQEPMTVSYTGSLDDSLFPDGERSWKVYPTSFPSYSRAIDEFAPMWKVEFEIEEADYKVQQAGLENQLSDIRTTIGFEPYWKFSDPLSSYANSDQIAVLAQAEGAYRTYLLSKFDVIMEWLPTQTAEEFTDLLFTGASVPEILRKSEATADTQTDPHQPRTDTSKPPKGGGGTKPA